MKMFFFRHIVIESNNKQYNNERSRSQIECEHFDSGNSALRRQITDDAVAI